jgi:proteasome lid subunit RPN8/RPN11
MVAHAIQDLPNECCGLLAGPLVPELPDQTVTQCFPLLNAEASPRAYTSDPKSLFNAHRAMREHGLEILAIYHSHPTTDPIPSRKDLEWNYHGSAVVHLIISLKAEVPLVRAWRLQENDFADAEWMIL